MNPTPYLHRTARFPHYYAAPVMIETAEQTEPGEWHLRVRTENGQLEELYVTQHELDNALADSLVQSPRINAAHQALLIEAERIRLAYAHDPHFAVSLSGVEPLPHQLEAVYERMLPQARLRFLLADDPGAGKTIMAGLLIKELKMRQAVERVLVLCPAPLTLQWQDEMRTKFDEVFEVIRIEQAKDQLAGNVWERYPQCIASIDFAKRDDVAPELLRTEWDLVIVDEAHKCAARWFGGEVKRTRRYQLVETLTEQSERLLLLTATPHSGSAEQFAYFLHLLDSDQFVTPDRTDDFAELNQQALVPHGGDSASPWFLRRVKEDLRNFNGEKLFTQRHAITVPFELSEAEFDLYRDVTEYINRFLPRQSGRRKAPIALARTVLQRRLASSVRAISRSLQRRYDRFNAVLRDVELLTPNKREEFLRAQSLLDTFDEEQEFEDADDITDEVAAVQITAAERIEDLRSEVDTLHRLVMQARRVEEMGDERKLHALLSCLERAEFNELKDGRGKLLIFTEHRDTLDYLRERLADHYTCVEIHGGMNALKRKEAQEAFRTSAQICLATDAAGEGINLQFCHLMINYDMPWNPMRLEQRMGRVHRIGQKLDVYIFNFVASNTVEGRVLETLLRKLNNIRESLGDRVFDVIGMMLRLNEVDLEEILREAAYNPRTIHDDYYVRQIEQISPSRLRELEQATGVAMATSHVDLGRIQTQDYRSEERRLMPEYVEQFFLAAAALAGLRVERRADGLYRIEHVPSKFRATTLTSVRRFGTPEQSYKKVTFRKGDILHNATHADAVLLSPGHPLFAAVTEVMEAQIGMARGTALYTDPLTPNPYRLHFFTVDLVGEEPATGGYKTVTQHAAVCVILENEDGTLEIAPPDVLHDVQPVSEPDPLPEIPNRQQIERHIQRTFVRDLLQRQRARREREIEIRREYLERTFESLASSLRRKALDLADKVNEGQVQYRIARDEAYRRVEEIEARMMQKIESLKHLRVLRPGVMRYLGSAEVRPVQVPIDHPMDMHSDPTVEKRAMDYVMQYERERGWTPTDVSQYHDGSGFDIRSVSPPDANGKSEVRRIEVKGRSGYNQPVLMTSNEWIQAGRHGESYWLYVVWGCGEGQTPQRLIIPNPAVTLRQSAQTVVKHYLIPAQEIMRVQHTE